MARGQYEKAIQLGHPFPDARVALARLYRARATCPARWWSSPRPSTSTAPAGAGGAAEAYVEMADAERARNARPEKLKDLFEKALERDPASCEALWGAGKAGFELERLTEVVKRRLGAYVKVCPGAPHAAEAEKLASGK